MPRESGARTPQGGQAGGPAGRLVAIVTLGGREAILQMASDCRLAAQAGQAVRVFFRDESIPALCKRDVAERLTGSSVAAEVEAALSELATSGDVRLYACSSSLYVWGVSAADLAPAIYGSRGLVAFLVDDLADASRVLTY